MGGNIPGGNFLGGHFLIRNNRVLDISRFYIKDLLQNSVYCKRIRTNVKCY